MDNPLTLQEAKDQVSKNRHWGTWSEFMRTGPDEFLLMLLVDEAAEMYARSKFDEACAAQKVLCMNSVLSRQIAKKIKNAPKPEFKP